MRYIEVSRYDETYCAFPDVARVPDGSPHHPGRLLCAYRECDGHTSRVFSRVVVRASDDNGETWSPAQTLIHHDSGTSEAGWHKWNCPRLSVLRDGRIALVCDWAPHGADRRERASEAENFLWWSSDGGETWDGPHPAHVVEGTDAGKVARGIVPDRIVETRLGTLLLLAHHSHPRTGMNAEYAYRSEDGGRTWQGPVTVAHDGFHRLCEASVVQLESGTLVCYLRENSGRGWVGFKSFSADDGRTWHGPYPTGMVGCHRPTAGLLHSGNVLITYGLRQGAPGNRDPFAALETQQSAAEPVPALQRTTLMAIDHDNHPQTDEGYTGWVQLPDGSIYCVYYIKQHQDNAWIKAAVFREEDIRR